MFDALPGLGTRKPNATVSVKSRDFIETSEEKTHASPIILPIS